MFTCSECGRKIKRPFFVNGQPYGSECFKEHQTLFDAIATILSRYDGKRTELNSIKIKPEEELFLGKHIKGRCRMFSLKLNIYFYISYPNKISSCDGQPWEYNNLSLIERAKMIERKFKPC